MKADQFVSRVFEAIDDYDQGTINGTKLTLTVNKLVGNEFPEEIDDRARNAIYDLQDKLAYFVEDPFERTADYSGPEDVKRAIQDFRTKMKKGRQLHVRLSAAEFDYCSKKDVLPGRLRALVGQAVSKESVHMIELSDEDADAIRDCCGDKLQEVGFGTDYELTPEGAILESLVDKFFTGK